MFLSVPKWELFKNIFFPRIWMFWSLSDYTLLTKGPSLTFFILWSVLGFSRFPLTPLSLGLTHLQALKWDFLRLPLFQKFSRFEVQTLNNKYQLISSKIWKFKFDYESCFIFAGDDEGQITILRIRAENHCQTVRTLSGHSGAITALLWNPASQVLYSTSQDKNIICWDIGGRQVKFELYHPRWRVVSVKWGLNIIFRPFIFIKIFEKSFCVLQKFCWRRWIFNFSQIANAFNRFKHAKCYHIRKPFIRYQKKRLKIKKKNLAIPKSPWTRI